MNDQEGNPVAAWDFQKAWPSKLTGPAVKSDSNEIGIEELVIVHEYIVRARSRQQARGDRRQAGGRDGRGRRARAGTASSDGPARCCGRSTPSRSRSGTWTSGAPCTARG